MLSSIFGSRKTPAEMLRQHQRALNKAQRELDRERGRLEGQEKKLVMDIKKAAKDGQNGALRVMAKDLVRTRSYVQKFTQMRTQLQAVSLRIQTLRSNQQMAEAMHGATKAMKSMNRRMNLPAIQKIMMEFEMESEAMDMKEEMMSDTMDDVMEGDEDEEEEEAIVQQVLDEIGINLDQSLTSAPTGLQQQSEVNPRQAVAEGESAPGSTAGMSADDAALQARLDNLRRG
ncbi:Snf7-domain-containing protein [Piptocephalis cylindrospora]|uniref:Snf7-domain-containing protein n=1 Tax=Piptocephalis cylindrospora TaxID=1907219 RepID=A0A4P9XZV6_9FUNG|nr:Snf7-domain-containing protein [Piptocephalis cylindrospora]|eukprot:RKP12038.1 Snf7-domain-containing protein [Piptocephalis cylindrospora]